MARIDIRSGLERDEFYANVNGEEVLIGTAVYDLNDAGLRMRVMDLADGMGARWQEFQEKAEAMPSETFEDAKEKTRLEVEYVEKTITDADAVFGKDFCAKALGANCRNILTLLEVLESIAAKYGAEANAQIDKFTKDAVNRAQRRHSNGNVNT